LSAEIEPHVVDLGCDVQFRYYGPQTERLIYCGTVGPTPEFNRQVIRLLKPDFDRTVDQDSDSQLCGIAPLKSPWTMIMFTEKRREWLIERLRGIVLGLTTHCS